jgi:hypothetical protein
MRLGIPLVISPDPALLEVTDGNAEVMDRWDAPALADAVSRAWARSPDEIERAKAHAATFTWSQTAARTRTVLADIASRSARRTQQP